MCELATRILAACDIILMARITGGDEYLRLFTFKRPAGDFNL